MLCGVTDGQIREEEACNSFSGKWPELTPHPGPQIGLLHLQDVSFKEHLNLSGDLTLNPPGISPLMASYHILGEYVQE